MGIRRPRRRMVVAFVEVETPEARIFRQAATGMGVDEVLAERPVPSPRGLPPGRPGGPQEPERGPVYWCAADKPTEDWALKVAPVYRTGKVSDDAECEVCGIGIRELQTMFTERT